MRYGDRCGLAAEQCKVPEAGRAGPGGGAGPLAAPRGTGGEKKSNPNGKDRSMRRHLKRPLVKRPLVKRLLGAGLGAGLGLAVGLGASGAALAEVESKDPIKLTLHDWRSEEHTSEHQSLMRISYAVFCLKKKNNTHARIT